MPLVLLQETRSSNSWERAQISVHEESGGGGGRGGGEGSLFVMKSRLCIKTFWLSKFVYVQSGLTQTLDNTGTMINIPFFTMINIPIINRLRVIFMRTVALVSNRLTSEQPAIYMMQRACTKCFKPRLLLVTSCTWQPVVLYSSWLILNLAHLWLFSFSRRTDIRKKCSIDILPRQKNIRTHQSVAVETCFLSFMEREVKISFTSW